MLNKKCVTPLNGESVPVLPGFFVKEDMGTGDSHERARTRPVRLRRAGEAQGQRLRDARDKAEEGNRCRR